MVKVSLKVTDTTSDECANGQRDFFHVSFSLLYYMENGESKGESSAQTIEACYLYTDVRCFNEDVIFSLWGRIMAVWHFSVM